MKQVQLISPQVLECIAVKVSDEFNGFALSGGKTKIRVPFLKECTAF